MRGREAHPMYVSPVSGKLISSSSILRSELDCLIADAPNAGAADLGSFAISRLSGGNSSRGSQSSAKEMTSGLPRPAFSSNSLSFIASTATST